MRRVTTWLLTLFMVLAMVPVSAFAEETSGAYVLMNIPYDAFYEAEGVAGVDAVSTATVKTYNQNMAAGSYHDGYEAADPITEAKILGVTYPVFVEDMSVLADCTVVKDEDTATITVASGKSTTTTKEVSGKDLLFASGDYAYYALSEAPANYKTLQVTEDGRFSFAEVKNSAEAKNISKAEIGYGGHYTDLAFDVEAEEITNDTVVTGITLTADGQKYALRHVENIWRKVSLGWNWGDLDGEGLGGKTITNVTYYTQDGGVYSYDVNVAVKPNPGDVEAAFKNSTSVKVTGLPEDMAAAKATVSSVVGRGETPVVIADNVEIVDGVITTDEAVDKTNYNVKITSDNYADVTVRVTYDVDTLEPEVVEMKSTSIGGLTYFYADTTGDDPATVYKATVRGRIGSTEYTFAKTDMMQVSGTEYYYTTVTGVIPLSGTLYGYASEGTPATYASVYGNLDVETDNTYDAISSATKYTGHHAKDIPSMVTFGTDAAGDKAITGLNLAREIKTVDALTYVEASILKAAGQSLSDEQEVALDITLKANPMNAPADGVEPKLASAEYTSNSRYGKGEFDIIPDDTVAGYVWSEYWGSVYAASISDGTNTVGAVHWIDLYGEAAVSGPHYNKIQIALNNGTSTASNAATVTRYAPFFDDDNELKAGTYTIKIYAEGYDVLEAEVKVYTAEENKAAADYVKALIEAAGGSFKSSDEAQAAVDKAKDAYDALTTDQKALLKEAMPDAETKISDAQAAADSQKAKEEADKKQAEADAKKKAEEAAKKAAADAAAKAAEAKKVSVGDSYVVSGSTYKVTKAGSAQAAGAVTFVKAKNAKNVTVPASVKLKDGNTYMVTQIGAKAFAGTKARKVTVKTANLTKKTVKNSLKGSKVKTVIVKVGKKKANKACVKKYKKIFTKKIAGKKVTVK